LTAPDTARLARTGDGTPRRAWIDDGVVLVPQDSDHAAALAHSVSIAHLEVQTADDWYFARLRNYGSIFLEAAPPSRSQIRRSAPTTRCRPAAPRTPAND